MGCRWGVPEGFRGAGQNIMRAGCAGVVSEFHGEEEPAGSMDQGRLIRALPPERRIDPAGGRVGLGLPDESGVPVVVSGCTGVQPSG